MASSSRQAAAPHLTRSTVADGLATGRRIATALGIWGFLYACYRGYYAAGGEVGMIGQPLTQAQFQSLNAVGAAVIGLAAILPPLCIRVRSLRRPLSALAWVVAVGCCMHALVDMVLRLLSVTGVHPTQLPANVWQSFDRHAADLQDLLLNEPWFLVEGLLWGALALVLVRTSRRRAWLLSAVVACVALTAVGVLTGLGLIAPFHLG